MKKPNKTKLKKQCIELAKRIVKENAKWKCERCGVDGKVKQLQGSHIYPLGRYGSMGADIDNILALCAGCHMWSSDSWHENPLESAMWFQKKYPDRYEILKKRSQQSVKCDLAFWQKKLVELKSLIK